MTLTSGATTRPATDVVVGCDGSVGSDGALDWAAQEARARGAGLRIVTATLAAELPFVAAGEATSGATRRERSHAAGHVVAQARRRAEAVLDPARIETTTIWGHPAGVLVDVSREAGLVVVGHPERGRAREYLTGSVAFAVAAHATCDVAVVPRGELVLPGPRVPVIVGVDGSAHGDRAAHAAASVAERSGAPLVLVRAWQLPSLTGAWRSEAEAPARPDEREIREDSAHRSTEHSAAAVRRAFPDVGVTVRLVEKHPVLALLDAAEGAGLVVVGSRGLGGFARLLLGSVSRAVIHHAQTPVLVVRSL